MISADEIMDTVSQAFAREHAKRQVMKTQDIETLREVCIALMQANDAMRNMLIEEMQSKLPRLGQAQA